MNEKTPVSSSWMLGAGVFVVDVLSCFKAVGVRPLIIKLVLFHCC